MDSCTPFQNMSDYERIEKAIVYISNNVEVQPSLEQVAAHVHLSPFHFQRLFSRWAGVTPKRFLQTLTVERAKRLLRSSVPVVETSYSVGLSSGSRLHDHFVKLEAVTPGEYSNRGKALEIDYAVHETPFGSAFLAQTPRGICELSFGALDGPESAVHSLQKKWPRATLRENKKGTAPAILSMFDRFESAAKPLSLHVTGTNFQVSVWRALLAIPKGSLSTYGALAASIRRPGSARAVGNAVGANPIAFIIPCHRVIRGTGELGGFRWGTTRKHAIHAWESADEE